MNDLEERVAVRYGEAKQFCEKLRSMRKSLNARDQVQAIDAAQSVVDVNRASFFLEILRRIGLRTQNAWLLHI